MTVGEHGLRILNAPPVVSPNPSVLDLEGAEFTDGAGTGVRDRVGGVDGNVKTNLGEWDFVEEANLLFPFTPPMKPSNSQAKW
ncbi:MAG: hypothetical protein ACKODH_03800 [Limisphaerales bacterium]